MEDLLPDFIAESRELLAALDAEVVAWEAAPDDRARLDSIFRCVHTIKGNSGFFDLPRLTALSHAAEEALSEVRSGRRAADGRLVSAILAALDRIGEMVDALEGGTQPEGDDSVLIAVLGGADEALGSTTVRHEGPARTVRLPVDLLDRMMSGISDLVLARNALARDLRESAAPGETFDRLSAAVADVREAVTRTRMQRLDTLFAPLPRVVRDLCAETGKDARLELDGGDVELDREMVELVRDPLVQMLRNAVAHGIETPAERVAAGKRPTGLLRLTACQSGNSILVELSDDGAGIDTDALAARAVSLGLIGAAEAAALPRERRLELLFAPGLSTAHSVTELAGRGVGMDVVRANIERIGGAVTVETQPGQGSRFTLRVPLTLTIIPGLVVEAGGQCLAVPRSAVEEIVRLGAPGVTLHKAAGSASLELRGRKLPLVRLSDALGLPASSDGGFALLLRASGGAVYALAVDKVDDQEELVVKPAAPPLLKTGLYGGTTLTENGRPMLLLDAAGLAGRCGINGGEQAAEPGGDAAASDEPLRPALLFTALCGATQAVPLAAVTRIEQVDTSAINQTASVFHVAIDDWLLPLAGYRENQELERVHILRIGDGHMEIGYAVRSVIDTISLPAEATPLSGGGAAVLVDGRHVELLDLHALFAAHAAAPALAERPLCLLGGGDLWIDTFLRPLVESAGYRTAALGHVSTETPRLIILGEDAADPLPKGAKVVRLRKSAGAGDADTIFRYDRDALLQALAAGRAGR
ncbi:MAG TPA: chemotaxis protein CheA [Allosphingosinicella sp.]|jgi:two-component system chemotaxis sensor kinase CheA